MRAGLASHLGDTPLSGELCHCHFPPTDTHRLSTIHGHSKHFPSASFFFFFLPRARFLSPRVYVTPACLCHSSYSLLSFSKVYRYTVVETERETGVVLGSMR